MLKQENLVFPASYGCTQLFDMFYFLQHLDGDWQKQAIEIIRTFFDDFSHEEVLINKNILHYKSLLEVEYGDCTFVWDVDKNNVEVTGPVEDVENFISRIQQIKQSSQKNKSDLRLPQFFTKCDGKISEYILNNPQYFNDLKSNVGPVARCLSLVVNDSMEGILTIEKKMVRCWFFIF